MIYQVKHNAKSVQSVNHFKSVIQTIKAHSGEIKVETKEEEGTEFIIQLR